MKRFFAFVFRATTTKPKTVLAISLLVTILLGFATVGLKMEVSWVGLTPKDHPSVKQYDNIMEHFSTMNNIIVIVEADNPAKLDQAVETAKERLLQLDEYVQSVSAQVNEDFLIKNGLMLLDENVIEMTGMALSDPNIDRYLSFMNMNYTGVSNQIQEGNVMTVQEEQGIASSLMGMDWFFHSLLVEENEIETGVNRLVFGDPYTRSIDGTQIVMMVQPTFDITDFEKVAPGVNAIEAELVQIEKEVSGISYGLTGMHVVGKDELEITESDSHLTTIIAMVGIFIVLYMAFRMISVPILAFIPLLIGVIWDFGIVSLVIGRLNIITVFTFVILIGLGIDFSLHLLSGFTEKRSKGAGKKESLEYTLLKVGPSILIGALSTAFAFFVMMTSSLDMLKELGFVMGSGILTTVLAVFFILPSILILGKQKNLSKVKGEYKLLGKTASFSHRYRFVVLCVVIVFIGIIGFKSTDNEFDLNMLNLEPKGLESVELMEKMSEDFGMSSEGLLVEQDSLEDIYKLSEQLKDKESVSAVMSIADILPDVEVQEQRMQTIGKIEQVLSQQMPYRSVTKGEFLQGLEDIEQTIQTLYEHAETDRLKQASKLFFENGGQPSNLNLLMDRTNSTSIEQFEQMQLEFYTLLQSKSQQMLEAKILVVDDLPSDLKSQLVSEDGKHFLLTAYPNFDIWEELKNEKGENFIHMLQELDPGFTGTPIFMKALYDSVKDEIVKTGILVLLVLFTILLLHFRSFKYALLAFLPLIMALVLTSGMMGWLGLKWNILNVLALPLIIGIGVDDGVHLLHRYKSTNQSIIEVFSSVGRAILITTLTTMIAFGSLMLASYRGLSSLGTALFIGVGFAFLLSISVLPIFLKERETTSLKLDNNSVKTTEQHKG
ncbi:efflux RND transporter permease subunit [Chengkuizengella sediminis]|uniref:efflux RND transporter permease subunit n=1 Tax=Chengkuizengella sediminis TaxID=1885917 RepID=UPI00138A5FCC|nr:MMPL family transporter [Chengkuizengella sediminis]NDI35470.1 MMPL family transporter [Chengkuizengella sediminis]